MLWINEHLYQASGIPPVLSAQTAGQIEALLAQIVNGEISLQKTGEACRQWIEDVHGYRGILPKLLDTIGEYLRLSS
jgi:hypothetical protein